jgi:uncharacterized protein YkwD
MFVSTPRTFVSTCSIALTLLLTAGCGPTGEISESGGIGEGPASSGDQDDGINLDPFITDGQVDPGHPSTGQLSGCTGTLIGKRTVLTAGHCVGSSGYFKVGGQKYYSAKIYRHPSYGGGNRNDVAVMILKQDVQGVTPSPIATQAPQDGQAITLVGFGKTGENKSDYGTKRFTTNTIYRVYSSIFSFKGSKNICNGDSGGPTFAQYGGQEVVIGVHSTKSGWCGNGGNDMRVDKYVSWIQQKAGNDVVLQGQGGNNPPQNPNPPPTPPTPPSKYATEGQTCHNKACAAGLSCVTVVSGQSTLGKWCMTSCTKAGSTAAPCNGSETCTNSSAGKICFAAQNPQNGYTSPGKGTTPPNPNPTPPQPPNGSVTEGKSCASQSCALGLACVSVVSGSKKVMGKFCMERCSSMGSTAAPCDGGDICTNSSQGPVCFNAKKGSTGYTSPGNSNPGGGNPGGGTGVCGGTEESEAFKLLNQTRAKYGRVTLACDKKALAVARAHSQDMCTRGYFSHTNKKGQAPWDRLKAGGVSFSAAGENIAYGYSSAQSVTDGWMKSSGHRKNMLSTTWKRAAIGMIRCNGSTPYWTEVFMR